MLTVLTVQDGKWCVNYRYKMVGKYETANNRILYTTGYTAGYITAAIHLVILSPIQSRFSIRRTHEIIEKGDKKLKISGICALEIAFSPIGVWCALENAHIPKKRH